MRRVRASAMRGPMTAALRRLVRRVAARLGPDAANSLLGAARASISDPASVPARRRLVAILAEVARRAGGATALLAAAAAAGVERYRRSVTT
jgi:hypothetical protein